MIFFRGVRAPTGRGWEEPTAAAECGWRSSVARCRAGGNRPWRHCGPFARVFLGRRRSSPRRFCCRFAVVLPILERPSLFHGKRQSISLPWHQPNGFQALETLLLVFTVFVVWFARRLFVQNTYNICLRVYIVSCTWLERQIKVEDGNIDSDDETVGLWLRLAVLAPGLRIQQSTAGIHSRIQS